VFVSIIAGLRFYITKDLNIGGVREEAELTDVCGMNAKS
jgi:hypothetical protein